MPRVFKKKFKQTTFITVLLIGVLAGLGLSKFDHSIRVELLVASVFFVFVALKTRKIFGFIFVLVFGLFAGLYRGGQVHKSLDIYDNYFNKNVTLRVVAITDSVYADKSQLEFDADKITDANTGKKLIGSMQVRGFGAAGVQKGDTVKISGRLYKRRGGKIAGMSFAIIEVISRDTALADTVNRKIGSGLQNSLPEPQASFGMGLLVGQRSNLPDDTLETLRKTGLMHIIAVSGYNVSILIAGVRRILRGRSKYQIILLSILSIVGFLLITGLSASIVRAAIVSTLSLLAWSCGRKIKPLILVLLPAVITGLWNPLYVWNDIGWYLSFLAFFGVIVIAPAIAVLLKNSEKKAFIKGLIIESICAQIMTLPLLMFVFGGFSAVSLIANLLVVPFVPLAMLFCVIAAGVGLMSGLIHVLAIPARWLLTYQLNVASILSRLSGAFVDINATKITMVIMYGVVLIFTSVLYLRVNRLRKFDQMDYNIV